ncbi:MAG: hypothetical protein JW892_04385 [Anaerolineae bacterium]|nr:hypothetical protein [Anaerolineae bacterium]
MDVAKAVRHKLKWVVVVGVLMLTVFSSSTVSVLSEASDGVAKVSASVITKRENKATILPDAQHASLPVEVVATPMPLLATPEARNSLSRPHKEQIDWPCRLPEGCEELYVETNPISASSEYTNSVTEMPTARLESQDEDAEPAWSRRYDIYQQLITEASEPLLQGELDKASAQENEMEIRLLHGRADVQNNAEHILAEGQNYPEIPPVLVAAAIAEQASDVERLFGVDTLEKAALVVPGLENMSIGIAQLRPEEALELGLGDVDLFDPEAAIQGMFAKIHLGNMRITELENPSDPLTLTERYMLLSLAQNGTSEVDEYFALGGDWKRILTQGNNARVMRYFLVHLDWLLLNGWELPGDVALDAWRETVFSTP